MMYLRFVTCLTVGLFGVSLVLMTVYDTLFQDWDVVKDVRLWAARVSRKHRTRYVMMDEERMKVARAYAAQPRILAPLRQVSHQSPGLTVPVDSGAKDLVGV
ncbi:MAG: hypothetical protein FD126_1867 [Elusimicrobia bacterium]|nr:MAG: hypothetical protein FD126_1867 [Elusimicrobiota bacterium]